MMAFRPKLSFNTMSTALLLSIVALPVSLIAFAVRYADYDSFWPVVWMGGVLPTIWVAAVILSIRDAVKRHSWRQIAGVVVLLIPTAILVIIMVSPRFVFHQLFTFRPVNLHLPTNNFILIQKFPVCAEGSSCTSGGTVTETKVFKLTKVPDGCCSLQVINGRGGKHKVEAFRVVLNGKEVNLPSGDSLQIASVRLGNDNEVNVQLSGSTDAYIFIVVRYSVTKTLPPA
jgi:hypothetical protein